MNFNIAVVILVLALSLHFVQVKSQYRNTPNKYYRTAIAPRRTNGVTRVQQPPSTVKRIQRQSQAPNFLQVLQQRPRAIAAAPVQNVRTVRAQAAAAPGHVQYLQPRPQQQQQRWPPQYASATRNVQYSQPVQQRQWPQQTAAVAGNVQYLQPRPPQQQLQQQYAPQATHATASSSAAATAVGFRNADFANANFNNRGFHSASFGGTGWGGAGYTENSGFASANSGGFNAGNYGNGFGGGNYRNYQPHRPNPFLYRNFASLYRDLDSKADDSNYDATAEMEEINDDFNGRSIVTPGQYPHMAALGFRTTSHEIEFKCGGSLISEVFVLTAAHCCDFNGQTPNIVKIGDIKLKSIDYDNMPQRRRVAQIIRHPFYNPSMHYHDIALILLNRPVVYTHFVRPIRLWVSDEIPYDKLYTMGYGSTSFAQAPTNVLTELDLSIVPWQQCNSTLPPDENAPQGILESQICAKDYEKNRDTCQGDSGGPLQLNLLRRRRRHRLRYYLVGITSYGTFCRSPYPGVYTRVSSYIDWIASVVWPDYFNTFFG